MKVTGFPGVEVSIRVDGKALLEFGDEGDDRRTQTIAVRYVEATSGSNFSVYVQTSRSQLGGDHKDHMFCRILLDGSVVDRPVLNPYSLPQYSVNLVGSIGEIHGRTMVQRFTFTDLSTREYRPYDADNIS